MAYIFCRRRKRSSANCQKFEINATQNLWRLWKDLNTGNYKIGKSIAFIVHYPKDREVFAADFRDRIVHHYLIDKLNGLLERSFIENSYACRVGKGTLFGIQQCQGYIKETSQKYSVPTYLLKGDFKNFFMSIDKRLLYKEVEQVINDSHYDQETKDFLKHLSKLIIFDSPQRKCILKSRRSEWDNFPKNKSLFYCDENHGLPIGNLTSQVFANLFMNKFDHWVSRQVGYRNYGRYVDDFFIISNSSQDLYEMIPKIRRYASEMGIILHPHKVSIQRVDKGVLFLGQVIKPYGTVVARKTVGNFYKTLSKFKDYPHKYKMDYINSIFGYFRQTKSYKLRKKFATSNLLQHAFSKVKFDSEWTKLIMKDTRPLK